MNEERNMPATLPSPKDRERSSELNIPAERLQIGMRALMEQMDPKFRNSINATIWLLLVDAFRTVETEFLSMGTYDQYLEDHRRTLISTIAQGEELVLRIKRGGMVGLPNEPTLEDLQATLNSLHATFRGEYGPHNSEKTNDLINELLNGTQREG
jgi:hypothetical protein